MNIDFHLYGTYVAALIAGCNNAEAKKIAFSAQMVDDFTEIVSPNGFTATSNSDIVTKDFYALLAKSEESINKVVNLCESWMVFHFIPGISIPGLLIDNQTVTDRSSLFSALGGDAVNYLIQNDGSPIYGSSVSLGIGCHMYADIYAHMCFSGLITRKPALAKNVYILDGSDDTERNLPDYFEHLPFATRYVLPGGIFMGHGIAGHYPDISTVKLKYVWNSSQGETVFIKDNTEFFACAFSELIRIIQKGHATYSDNVFVSNEDYYNTWYHNIVMYLQEKKQENSTISFKNRYSMDNDNSFKELLENNTFFKYCTQAEINTLTADGIETPANLLVQYEAYKDDVKSGNEDKELFEVTADVIRINMLANITNPETNMPIDIKSLITAEF
jgi:hypothetical protein